MFVLFLRRLDRTQQNITGQISDSEYMLQRLRALGFWAHTEKLAGGDHGGPDRIRAYWIALRHLVGDDKKIQHFFHRLIVGFRISPKFPIEEFITVSDEERASEARALKLPLHAKFGPRPTVRQNSVLKWKLQHKLFSEANGIQWPLKTVLRLGFSAAGLFPRELEVAILLDTLWPPQSAFEFVDVNPVLPRIVEHCVSDMSTMQILEGKTPWNPEPSTLVGSTKMLCRIKVDDDRGSVVRILEAFEYFRLQGWSDELWCTERMPPAEELCVEDLELYPNMAGNAYSAFHFIPMLLAGMATYGRFAVLEEKEPMTPMTPVATTDEEDESVELESSC